MAQTARSSGGGLGAVSPTERARLVGLCYRLTGDPDAAEDLAQETLLEAWRNAHKLHNPSGLSAWLSAIARNVCARWARGRGRELSRTSLGRNAETDPRVLADTLQDDGVDLDLELERAELAELLDRALALLPAETRAVLVQSFIEEAPHAEIAARLGMSENLVAKRLQRGKLTLRRFLTTDLSSEAAAFGLGSGPDAWHETRIWCPLCGGRKLLGRLAPESGELLLSCPCCTPGPHDYVDCWEGLDVLRGIRGYGAAISRVSDWAGTRFRCALSEGVMECLGCGHENRLLVQERDATVAAPHFRHDVRTRCLDCGRVSSATLHGLTLLLPEGRRFRRAHPKVRALPIREVETSGRPALVAGYEGVAASARLEVVYARDTFFPIAIHTS